MDGLPWMEACAELGIPYVTIAESACVEYWPHDHRLALLRKAFQGALASYFVSRQNLRLTEFELGMSLANARIVRNPVRVSRDGTFEWPPEPPFVLACVGRLEVGQKGQDILFDVMKLAKWRERPLKVILYGSGPHEQSLRLLKTKLSLDNVEFGGFVHDPGEIWRRAHGLVLASRYEGFPITLVEAMMCRRMAVVTDIADNRELVEDGVTGFLAAAPTLGCLDNALEQAWQRRAEWWKFGVTAGSRVREVIPSDPVGVFSEEVKNWL